MTQRNWIILGIAALIIAGVAFFVFNRQGTTEAAKPEAMKSLFVDYCLKQANSAALQQGNSFNEEQKQMLQQVCGCGANQVTQKFSPSELAAFQANQQDPNLLSHIKEIMQSCVAAPKTTTTP